MWQAEENSHLMVGRTSARFNRFTIAKGLQQAVFDGELSNTQPGSFQCTLSNIELNELKRFALIPLSTNLREQSMALLRSVEIPAQKQACSG